MVTAVSRGIGILRIPPADRGAPFWNISDRNTRTASSNRVHSPSRDNCTWVDCGFSNRPGHFFESGAPVEQRLALSTVGAIRFTFALDTLTTKTRLGAVKRCLAAPLFYEHMLSAGASWFLANNLSLNAAYSYYLPKEISGPVALPGVGVIPGASVSQSLDVHILSVGLSVRF
jgi:hypothetical protein